MMLSLVFLFFLTVYSQAQEECLHRSFGNSATVCVCNANHCDTVGPIQPIHPSIFYIFTSNIEGLRLTMEVGNFGQPASPNIRAAVINRNVRYQTIHGFGGAFTDSAGININSLSFEARDHLMRSYFSTNGIEYNLGRVPIGGTDFSTRAYTYLDTPEPDMELANFALQMEDFNYKIPLIRIAQTLTNGALSLFSSAWTAPIWMKTNEQFAGTGFLKTEMYQVWADYFRRFLDEYEDQGIDFWGITTGNEPSLAFFSFMGINSVGWFPWTMNQWIRRNLGPTLRNSQHQDINIITHDDQRIMLPIIDSLFSDEVAKDYVDGVGVHWYWNDFVPASWLTQLHNKYPDKFILPTEACKGDRPWEEAVVLGSWERGQEYAVDIIENLQNWAVGWMDWNLALNMEGGPTYINNTVDSPIIVNAAAGEFYKQPMFYAMGHFSKFLPRGSVRIGAPNVYDQLLMVAFTRPDDGTTIVVLNNEDVSIPIVILDGSRTITRTISPKSFSTILYW